MSEQVTAVVILRNSAGLSILDEQITSANEAKYQVESYILDEASNVLEGFGFDILQIGTHTLTIAASQETFERIFKTSLKKKTHELEGMYFENTKPFIIPDELSSLVADIDIETPIDYFP